MTYSASELEKSFKKVARIRQGEKYANDAGYWTGGRCEWGGSHSLSEDCQVFANAFNKIGNLKNIKVELQKCTSKGEYDAKKQNYIRQCEESEAGLKVKTSASSMFYVCCIWSDEATNKTVESKIKVVQQEIQSIKSALQKEDYKWVQELKDLESEINQITQRMEENKRKAMSETDPVKKSVLISQIEEDGLLLKKKYEKKKELSKKFNFDPNKKVDELIEAMKKAIEKHGKKPGGSGGGGSKRNPNPTNSDNETESDSDSSDDDDNSNKPNQKKDQPNFFQSNQQLILIAGVAVLIIFFFYTSQKPSKPTYNYDF